MLRPETIDKIVGIMRRYDGHGGWDVRVPFFTVKGSRVAGDAPEDHATYLDVQWALEQIREWGQAVKSDMPMRRVARRKAKGTY